MLEYALGDKVIGDVPEEEFRNANPLYSKEFFSYLGQKVFENDHGTTPEFNPKYEYNKGDVVQYKGYIYYCTNIVLPQQEEVPEVGSKYWQRMNTDQILVKDYTDENGDHEFIPDFTEYKCFFLKIKSPLNVRIPVSQEMRQDGIYDLYISHVGNKSKIRFNKEFEGKFVQSQVKGVEHIKVIVKDTKTYLFQEVTSLGNIIGDLTTFLESSGYVKATDVYKIINK